MDLVDLAIGALLVGNEFADIDARNLRADDRRELFDGNRLVRLALASCVPVAWTLLAGQ